MGLVLNGGIKHVLGDILGCQAVRGEVFDVGVLEAVAGAVAPSFVYCEGLVLVLMYWGFSLKIGL